MPNLELQKGGKMKKNNKETIKDEKSGEVFAGLPLENEMAFNKQDIKISEEEKIKSAIKTEKSTGQEDVTEALKEAIQEQAREDEQPFSSNFTLRKILGGDILTAQLIRSQIWLIVLIVFFIILYISNRYSVQKDLLEIDRLNTELKDAKYKALSSSSQLTEKCRESHVLQMLQNNKDSVLKMPNQPPYIISIPE